MKLILPLQRPNYDQFLFFPFTKQSVSLTMTAHFCVVHLVLLKFSEPALLHVKTSLQSHTALRKKRKKKKDCSGERCFKDCAQAEINYLISNVGTPHHPSPPTALSFSSLSSAHGHDLWLLSRAWSLVVGNWAKGSGESRAPYSSPQLDWGEHCAAGKIN